ncbi:MAG: hypothetical protein RMK29_03570 [Myxococcales bacterium]|nr:hypothetical protein [Myxococcota bacterium]MDW8280765.1 hypothetical protein [Myxococcales bacterium]
MRKHLLALLPLVLSACPSATQGGDDDGLEDHAGLPLRLEPPALAIEAVEDGPGSVHRFTLHSPLYGDVTLRASWTLTQARLGSIAAGVLTVHGGLREGGQALVVARFRGGMAHARLSVKLKAQPLLDEGLGPEVERAFAEAGPGGPPPALVYPLAESMLPRNLGGMVVQWRAEPGQDLFRLRVQGSTFSQDLYTGARRCAAGTPVRCQWPVPDRAWLRIAAAAAGSSLELTLAGLGGGRLGVAAPLPVHISPEDVRGGLYYFSTSQWGLMRVPFGGTQALPFLIGDRLSRTGSCIGCHSITRDGLRVAAVFGGGDGYGGIVDGADANTFLRAPWPQKDGRGAFSPHRVGQIWNFTSFSPSGDRIISTWAGRMELRDGRTGELVRQVPPELLGGPATMPDWSPDGRFIAFVRVPRFGKLGKDLPPAVDFGELDAGDWLLVNAGDLAILPYNDGAFGPATTLLAATERGEYHFYPSFSPDGRFLVFNSARHGECATDAGDQQGVEIGAGNCTSYDQRNARLRLLPLQPGAQPLELSRATVQPNRTTTWPRFSPFLQDGGRLGFIAFSAKLDYGFRLVQPDDRSQRRPQLWMAAVDLGRAAAGQGDPSFAPFWLPFQELAERNHLAIWTQDLVCRSAAECGPGFACLNGLCVPRLE